MRLLIINKYERLMLRDVEDMSFYFFNEDNWEEVMHECFQEDENPFNQVNLEKYSDAYRIGDVLIDDVYRGVTEARYG